MRKLLGILCIFILCLSLTACSGEEVLVDILSKAIAKAMEENGGNLPDQILPTEEDASEESQEEAKDMFQLYECWAKVVGYWNAAEGHFALPDMMDSHTAVFIYGIWDTEAYSGEGLVTELYESKEQELTAFVYYAAQEANELHDAVEERTITVVIDYSGLDQDGKIRIKIGEDDWKHYMFAGNTSEEAYQTYWDNTYGAE